MKKTNIEEFVPATSFDVSKISKQDRTLRDEIQIYANKSRMKILCAYVKVFSLCDFKETELVLEVEHTFQELMDFLKQTKSIEMKKEINRVKCNIWLADGTFLRIGNSLECKQSCTIPEIPVVCKGGFKVYVNEWYERVNKALDKLESNLLSDNVETVSCLLREFRNNTQRYKHCMYNFSIEDEADICIGEFYCFTKIMHAEVKGKCFKHGVARMRDIVSTIKNSMRYY